MHLISTIQRIFRKEKLDTLAANIRPYYIQAGRCPQPTPRPPPAKQATRSASLELQFLFGAQATSRQTGVLEAITDGVSIDQVLVVVVHVVALGSRAVVVGAH